MTEGRRGRPKRGEATENSNQCVIKDPLMEPFYICKDQNNFTVHEKFTSDRGFAGKKPTGKEQERVVGYYSTFKNALNKIAKEKFYQNEGEYNSIQDYINTWDEVKTGVESLLNKIEI